MSRQLNLNPTYTTPPLTSPHPFLCWRDEQEHEAETLTKLSWLRALKIHNTYLHRPGRPDRAAGRKAETRGGDGEGHETSLPAQWSTSNLSLRSCIPFFYFLFYSCAANRRGEHQNTHARSHTRARSQQPTQPTPPPGTARTFLILLTLLKAKAFCSVLFPFSLSMSAPPFPFSISSFSHFTTHAVGFSSQPPPSPLVAALPPSCAASPSISSPLSPQCVLSERPLSEPQQARTIQWRSVQ